MRSPKRGLGLPRPSKWQPGSVSPTTPPPASNTCPRKPTTPSGPDLGARKPSSAFAVHGGAGKVVGLRDAQVLGLPRWAAAQSFTFTNLFVFCGRRLKRKLHIIGP